MQKTAYIIYRVAKDGMMMVGNEQFRTTSEPREWDYYSKSSQYNCQKWRLGGGCWGIKISHLSPVFPDNSEMSWIAIPYPSLENGEPDMSLYTDF